MRHLAVHHEMYLLGDTGGMVANPLDILRDEQHVRARGNKSRILHHVGKEFPKEARI